MGSGPQNHIIVFSADGFPIQYAFVPSSREILSGLKPFSFAKAGYASSRLGVSALNVPISAHSICLTNLVSLA